MLKVLQINVVEGILSTGRTTRELASQLKRMGHKSFIAYSRGFIKLPGTYCIGNPADRKFHALGSRLFGLQGYFSHLPTYHLIRYIGKVKPDVVHLRNLHGNFLNLNMLLKYLGKMDIPTVITLHDCWYFTGRCTHYTVNECYQWQTCCLKCPNNRNTMPSWFFDRSKKMYLDKKKYFSKLRYLSVVGVSDWITKEAKRSFLTEYADIRRIYNWVDLNSFIPREDNYIRTIYKAEEKFIILGVAALWVPEKGLLEFIKIAKHFRDCLVLLVGTIDKDLSIPDNLKTIPLTLNSVALSRIYSASDVLVSLSMEESFGKIIAEAYACGTPVVAYNSTASAELVTSECGCTAITNTLEDVFAGIQVVKKNKKKKYTENCRQYAIKNFNLTECAEDYIKIYEELLQKKTADGLKTVTNSKTPHIL